MMTSPSEPVPSVVRLSRGPAAFLDVGRGAPVVFVHGLPGRARDFRWLFAPMAGQVRLLAVDLPGFGQTPVATGPDASPEGRAAFVLELVDALGLERPVLVGHSMGGVVAVAAIAQRPARFSALGLISSPGLRPHAAYARVPRRALHLALRGPWAPLLLPLAQRLFAAAGFRGYPDSALVRTSACLRHTDLDAHAERLRRVALPTLAAWCQDDPVIEPEILAELAAVMPEGPRLTWPTGGHVPQKTHADELAEALLGLATRPPTGAPPRGSLP